MSGRQARRRGAGAAGLLAAAALLAGCGSHPAGSTGLHASTPAPGDAVGQASGAPPATPTPATPTESAPESAPGAPALGDVALTHDELADDCAGDAEVSQILPTDGTVVVTCTDEEDVVSGLVALDPATGALLWRYAPPEPSAPGTDTTTVLPGGHTHVYVLTLTDHPADGLKDEYQTRTVSALDAATGAVTWTQPLAPEDTTSTSTDGAVTESPTADGSASLAVVDLDGLSAFDGATGKPLWRVPELDPTGDLQDVVPVGFGLTLGLDEDEDTGDELVATSLATGKRTWEKPFDEAVSVFDDDPTVWTSDSGGPVVWFMTGDGFDAYDVLTGKQTVHGVFPTSFENTVATPDYTVALVDGTLRAYRTGDWSTLLWSVPADSAEPELVTSEGVVVRTQAGTLLLDMADGSTVSSDVEDYPDPSDVHAGYAVSDDGDVVFFGRLADDY